MNPQKITCFLTVAETLNFSEAARQLYMSQSTVTYQIQTLERELGVSLFHRTTTSTRLTEAGKVFLEDARKLNEIYQHIQQSIRQLKEKKSFTVVVPPTMILLDLEIFRELFHRLEQLTELTVKSMTIQTPKKSIQDLLEGRIDLLFVQTSLVKPFHKQLKIYPLFYCQQFVILPAKHPLAAKEKIDIKDVAGETVFLTEEDPCFLPSVKKALIRHNIQVTFQTLKSYQLMTPFIEMNHGISFTSLQFPVPDTVCFRPIDLRENIQISLSVSKNNLAPDLPLFVEAALKYFQDYPWQLTV